MLAFVCLVGPWWLYWQPGKVATVGQPAAVLSSSPRAQQGSPLGLQAARLRGGIEINWDKSLPEIAGAQAGLLQIIEGTSHLELPLGQAELTAGRLFYVPRSGDLDFRLTVFAASGAIRDVLRVVHAPGVAVHADARNGTQFPVVPRSSGSAETGAARVTTLPAVTSAPAARVTGPPAVTSMSTPAAPSVSAAESAVAPPMRNPSAPQITSERKETPVVEQDKLAQLPVPIGSQRPNASTPGVEQNARQPAVIPRNPVPVPSQQSDAADPPVRIPTPTATPQGAVAERVVTPPVAAKQVAVAVPAHLKPFIPAGTVISVRMKVDAQGRVTEVLTREASGVMAHLTALTRGAAHQWKFQPATVDGKAVPSEHLVSFKFSR